MKIDENFSFMLKLIGIFFISHLFSPGGRVAGFHRSASGGLLRTRHPPEAASLVLKCLAYESFRLVQNLRLPGFCMKIIDPTQKS